MQRQRQRGFTLIELLVVIAIIAILAAILFPIFRCAKSSAKLAGCLGHGKQLSSAILMYAQDNGEHMCGLNGINRSKRGYSANPVPDDDPSTGSLWRYYRSRKVLFCPADRERWRDGSGPNIFSFTLNAYVSWRFPGRKCPGPAGKAEDWGPPLAMFPRSTKTVALVEENVYRSDDASPVIDWCFIYRDYVTTRHTNDRGVLTFLDGHAATIGGGPTAEWRTGRWPDGAYIFHDGSIFH